MSDKIKISAVSYLNSLPFIYGIESSNDLLKKIKLSKDIPAICAKKLIENEVEIGLIPVAEINKVKDPHIISNYCIGAVGKVHSVLLLSDVPLNEIESIYLDYQSKTSVNLLRILAGKFWKISPQFLDTKKGFEKDISGKKAGLIIGDRAFDYAHKFKNIYDLSEEWMKFTSFPFVFAAWVSNKKLTQDFIDQFNRALEFGLDSKEKIIQDFKDNKFNSKIDIAKYLNNDISYSLDEDKKKGMNLFLKMLKSI